MGASHVWLKDGSVLAVLLKRARRRRLSHLLLDEAALAFAFVLGGAVTLLLLGSEPIVWYSLLGLLAAGFVLSLYRATRRCESEYAVAQRLDHNLNLHDALSTSVYFGDHPDRTRSPRDIVERQRSSAEDTARGVDIRAGVPFVAPRSVYACASLAVAIIGVFGLRYGVMRNLDLRPSLVRIAFDGFLGPRLTAENRKKPNDPRAKDWQNPTGLSPDPWQAKGMDKEGAPEAALDVVDTPDVNNNKDTGSGNDSKAKGKESQNQPDQTGEGSDDSERSNGANDQSPDGSQMPSKEGAQNSKQGDQKAQQSGDNSSLSEKMRDAIANLLSKMKMQPKSGGNSQQQSSSGQNSPQQSAQNRGNKDQSGSPSGKPQADANSSQDGQSSQDAQGAQQAQNGQGKNDGKSASNSQEGKSGIGSQDGDKAIKEAEQLAAMGKISEIIGKRAQNITGEVMIETASGKQQLRTQYTQRSATHGDSGGEINRDEVPLAYQQYVQQYFEEIRKLPAAKAKPAAKGDSKKAGT
ncbi:MAG TPA: hypothetical protein VKU01_27690 [Bryobacteraceae bacterium]|nr:hypothetical protein [Bryobacteraceae bacterium]